MVSLILTTLTFVQNFHDDSTAPYLSVSHEVDVSHPVEYRNCPVTEIDNRMGMGTGVVGYPEEYTSYQGTEGNPLVHSEVHQMQQQEERESLQHRQAYVS